MRRLPANMPGNFVPDSGRSPEDSAVPELPQELPLSTIETSEPDGKGIRRSVLNLQEIKTSGTPTTQLSSPLPDTSPIVPATSKPEKSDFTVETEPEQSRKSAQFVDPATAEFHVQADSETDLNTGQEFTPDLQSDIAFTPESDPDPESEAVIEVFPEPDVDPGTKVYPIPKVPRAQLLYPGFQNALDFMRENFRLPREIQLEQQKSSRTWLLAKLDRLNNKSELRDFAVGLSRKDQALLFPVLATLKKKQEIDKLEKVILYLSSRSQYIHGWLTLQFAYPRSVVATTLTKLCLDLEDKYYFSDTNYGTRHLHRSKNINPTPEIIWSQVPIITSIAHPNSRHFIKDLAIHYLDSGLDYISYCTKYAIYPDLSLGQALNEKIESELSLESQNATSSRRFFRQNN